MTVHPTLCCLHTEKKSDRKSGYLLPSAPSKPVAPFFLQGLSDLKVMDGSQVTMTVQVSGLCLHLSPQGICENGHGCSVDIAPPCPTEIFDPPEGQPGTVSQRTQRNEACWSLCSASSRQDFLDSRLIQGGPGEEDDHS